MGGMALGTDKKQPNSVAFRQGMLEMWEEGTYPGGVEGAAEEWAFSRSVPGMISVEMILEDQNERTRIKVSDSHGQHFVMRNRSGYWEFPEWFGRFRTLSSAVGFRRCGDRGHFLRVHISSRGGGRCAPTTRTGFDFPCVLQRKGRNV